MKYVLIVLLFIGTACVAQSPDTLIYIDRHDHDMAVASMQSNIDSVQNLLDLCREFIAQDSMIINADTFNVTIHDDRINLNVSKKGHNVWYTFVDGFERINADYLNYRRSVMLMDSTYTVGSLYVR